MRVYAGILGQFGDIFAFTPTVRRIKEQYPDSEITFAVSRQYREAGELIAALPTIDDLFIAKNYFELLRPDLAPLWQAGWPVDMRGEDEIKQQRKHDIVFETRPRHQEQDWWKDRHLTEELAYQIGAPIPTDLQTDICVPEGTTIPDEWKGKIVFHNDPNISPLKSWPWEQAQRFLQMFKPGEVLLLGNPGPDISGAIDLRGKTTLAEAAAIISKAKCYVGVDSGLMWIAGSLIAPTVGLYGTEYCPGPEAFMPVNPNAVYLKVDGPLAMIGAERVREAVS